ncbi:MAG: hypothetical protein HYR90_01725 [Candidatus Andersenbacteria bacterium]|nr:hypothetical protein [Candidatus Andersenbacteria bacterium]MBI3250879.1 hypothetical protein [Candidatus Andersenbacteria bacterium]
MLDGKNASEGARDNVATNPKLDATEQMLVGVWGNDDDINFSREFKADGTVVDSYIGDNGPTSTTGTWTVFDATSTEPVTFQLNNFDSYVKMMMDGDALYFRVSKISTDQLELIYMERGGALRFSKVQ